MGEDLLPEPYGSSPAVQLSLCLAEAGRLSQIKASQAPCKEGSEGLTLGAGKEVVQTPPDAEGGQSPSDGSLNRVESAPSERVCGALGCREGADVVVHSSGKGQRVLCSLHGEDFLKRQESTVQGGGR